MTRVMDGVVRQSWVKPTPIRMPDVRPVRTVLQAPVIRAASGLDGISRTAPTLLEQAPNPPIITKRPLVFLPGARQSVAFGLIAMALMISGFTAVMLNKADGPTASAESVVHSQPTSKPNSSTKPSPAAVLADQTAPSIQSVVDSFAAGQSSKFGIVVKDLKTGETASLNADHSETSASFYKLYAAQQIFAKIDSGALKYSDQTSGGTDNTVDGCLTLMITISDNGCGLALGDMINWGAQNPSLKAKGYTGTDLATPQQTSPHDVAKLMESLYQGTLNSPNSNAHFLGLLKNQRVNNRLPLGLPSGTVIAHKTGDLDGYFHDAGIVYGPKTDYLVVVMGSPGTNFAQFIDISSKLWAHFEN